MKLLLTFLLLISTSILAVNSFSFNFLNPYGHAANKFCYVKAYVRIKPFEFWNFVDWNAKIAANQELYNQRAHIGTQWIQSIHPLNCFFFSLEIPLTNIYFKCGLMLQETACAKINLLVDTAV